MSCTMTVNHSNSYTVLQKSLQLMISVVYVAVVQLVTWRRFLWSWAVNLPSSSSATATWTKQWEWWEKTTSVKSYRCKVIVVLSLLCVFVWTLQGMSSVYFNKGENCIAAGRLFVEESIHDEYIRRVVRVSFEHIDCILKPASCF